MYVVNIAGTHQNGNAASLNFNVQVFKDCSYAILSLENPVREPFYYVIKNESIAETNTYNIDVF